MRPHEQETIAILERCGAIRSGHFLLSSGLHSERYCQCASVFEHPVEGARLAALLAGELGPAGRIDTVLAPALGGMLFGYDLARALGARSLFAEREGGGAFQLRRGFELQPGERVLLAEDVVTTGKSLLEVVPLVGSAGAVVAGFAAIVDRSRGSFRPAEPFFALCGLDLQTWSPDLCPLCAKGIPATKPGSRRHASHGGS